MAGLPQVSPALAVLLLAAVIILLLWLIVLKPGSSSDSTSASAPPAAQPSTPVPAVTTTGPTQRVVPGRGHVVHRSGTRRGVPQPGDTNGRIVRAVAAHHVVALLVSNPGGADDDAVRAELDGLRYSQRQVLKVVVGTSQVANLPVITASVGINQTPTFVIIDRSRTVTTIVGYASPFELATRIDQALAAPVNNAPVATLHLQPKPAPKHKIKSRAKSAKKR